MRHLARISLTFLLAAVFWLGAFNNARADAPQREARVTHENQQKGRVSFPAGLTAEQVIEDFIHVTLNGYVSQPKEKAGGGNELDGHAHSGWLARFPEWYRKYLVRELGEPKPLDIAKWRKPIRIGLGDYQTKKNFDFHLEEAGQASAIEVTEMRRDALLRWRPFGLSPYLVVDDQVKAMLPVLADVTGRDLSYAPGEFGGGINLVILFDDLGLGGESFFKWKKYWSHQSRVFYQWLRGKVSFTPNHKSQVEGFLVLDDGGAIDRAVCMIFPHHNSDLIRALVSECLVRAMGVTRESLLVPDALVGAWNVGHDVVLEPINKNDGSTDCMDPSLYHFLHEADTVENFNCIYGTLSARTDYQKLHFSLSAYDKALLRLLYSPDVKIGDDERQLRKILPDLITATPN